VFKDFTFLKYGKLSWLGLKVCLTGKLRPGTIASFGQKKKMLRLTKEQGIKDT